MIISLVFIITVIASSGEATTSQCQSGCSSFSIPSAQCVQAYSDLLRVLGLTGQQLNSNALLSCNIATLRRLLDIHCSSECLSTFPAYRICTNSPNGELEVNITRKILCSRHADGMFCAVKILEEATNGSLLPPCAAGGTCDSACQESYRNISSRLGCCGSSWYDSPGSFSIGNSVQGSRLFTTCNVPLNSSCELATII